jgi:hypothetical protein
VSTTATTHPQWFVYRDGRLEPDEEPAWAGEFDFDEAMRTAGFSHQEACGGDGGAFAVDAYSHRDAPHWLFLFDAGFVYTVEVHGFPDYLDFLAKIAPVATTGYLSGLSFTLERALESRKSSPAFARGGHR